jgi:hypothetical protein
MDKRFYFLMVTLVAIISLPGLAACSGPASPATTPSPGGGAVVQSDSVVTGEIKAIRQQTSGYPWEVEVLVRTSEDVGGLVNPTKDKVGQVITARTDQDMSAFKVGQVITSRVKYAGDVPRPGISLYIYNIRAV